MEGAGGAFGGGKAATGAQDPLTFLKRPNVTIRIAALIFAIIVFGCISSNGWTFHQEGGKDVCVMNEKSGACHYATFVGLVGFLASFAFIAGEWFFEKMSSIKTRKHYVIVDMAFSGLWAGLFAIAVLYMSFTWANTDEKYSFASANVLGAIFFAFLSVGVWGAGAFFAYQRFKAGSDTAFTQGIDGDDGNMGVDAGYGAYDENADYNEAPFSGGEQAGANYTQQMQY